MSYCDSRHESRDHATDGYDLRRYARLAATATLAGDAGSRWLRSRLGIAGGGVLGSKLAPEAVRSGAGVCVYDPTPVAVENLGTQSFTAAGPMKVDAIREACEAIRSGSAEARPIDVLHAGVGELAGVDLLVDCTDDPNLEGPLTEISNGLQIPMLRLAVDGSGEHELGRIQVSHGGGGAACRLCAKSLAQVLKSKPRTPCPGAQPEGPPPTLAGNGIALAVVGAGLLHAQRLLGGTAPQRVLNSQLIIDLDNFQILAIAERRCEQCLSGHLVWDLLPVERTAAAATFDELFDAAAGRMGAAVDTLEPYLHPLCLAARCECGRELAAVGTRWAAPPCCPACRKPTSWQRHTEQPRWTRGEAQQAGILRRTAAELGLPARGAMLIARRHGAAPKHLVLR